MDLGIFGVPYWFPISTLELPDFSESTEIATLFVAFQRALLLLLTSAFAGPRRFQNYLLNDLQDWRMHATRRLCMPIVEEIPWSPVD